MEFAYTLNGNTPMRKSFQIGEAMATAGVPVVVGGGGNHGIALASTTAAVNQIGVTVDAQATLVTAQQTDNSDPTRMVSVIISPDAVFRARLSGGAAENTALTQYTVSTASTTGLVVTTGDSWSSPTFDEGTLWGFDGSNTGVERKITSVGTTAATLLVALTNDTAVGDNFLRVPLTPGELQHVQLTTLLTQINASVAVDTNNANFIPVDLELRDSSDSGATNSNALVIQFDSVFSGG